MKERVKISYDAASKEDTDAYTVCLKFETDRCLDDPSNRFNKINRCEELALRMCHLRHLLKGDERMKEVIDVKIWSKDVFKKASQASREKM